MELKTPQCKEHTFAAVDAQELLTFTGNPYLWTNILMSFLGSLMYIVGSVVREGTGTECMHAMRGTVRSVHANLGGESHAPCRAVPAML